jgi:hypothetical protein
METKDDKRKLDANTVWKKEQVTRGHLVVPILLRRATRRLHLSSRLPMMMPGGIREVIYHRGLPSLRQQVYQGGTT